MHTEEFLLKIKNSSGESYLKKKYIKSIQDDRRNLEYIEVFSKVSKLIVAAFPRH